MSVWERGRLDGRAGSARVLFGQMYEDPSIELAAFRPGGRVFCIASAGCTAIALAPHHDVVAVDVNPSQLAYVRQRLEGMDAAPGTVERLMDVGRRFAPIIGWRRSTLDSFLALDAPTEQLRVWDGKLNTWRFRRSLDLVLSVASLRMAYAPALLDALPKRFGAVLRSRLARGFARHANRNNPYARALLRGDLPVGPPPPDARRVRLVCADAALYLESQPPASFRGLTLSNILDGAEPSYRRRLLAAVDRAAAPGAVSVLRSFGEAHTASRDNQAAEDRSMIWGSVLVRRH